MVEEYVEQLTALMKQATAGKFADVELECKHFFSGAAVYVDGRISMSLTPVGFALKLPERSRNSLIQNEGAVPLRLFPKGPIKKDYVVLAESMTQDRKSVRRWVTASIEYVRSLPKPVRRVGEGANR